MVSLDFLAPDVNEEDDIPLYAAIWNDDPDEIRKVGYRGAVGKREPPTLLL